MGLRPRCRWHLLVGNILSFEIGVGEHTGECKRPEKYFYDVGREAAHELIYEHKYEQAQTEGRGPDLCPAEKDQLCEQLARKSYPSEGSEGLSHGGGYARHLSRVRLIAESVYEADEVLAQQL